jgi:hypothetical protein
MATFGLALIFIFCTPFGWIGLLIFGCLVAEIVEASRR